jgi:hypothetical protein
MAVARLNRRRYLEISRMLKSAIADTKIGWARRLRAGQMLLDVYERHDRAVERREAASRFLPTQTVAPSPPAKAEDAHLDAEAAALLYLKSIKAGGGDIDHDDED